MTELLWWAIYYLSLASAILFGVVGQFALKSGAVGSQTEGVSQSCVAREKAQ